MGGLVVKKEESTYYIEEVINERSNFVQLFQDKSNPLTLNLKNVKRINSAGVRLWTEALYPAIHVT